MPNHSRALYLDQLKTAIVVVDPKLRVEYLNSAAEQLLHLSARRAQQQSISDFFIDGLRLSSIIEQAWQQQTAYIKRQVQVTLHDGHETIFDFAVTPSDAFIILEMYALDRFLRITSEEHIYQTQESTKSLIRSLAHEIKNPLGGILGAAQLLGKQPAKDNIEEYTQVIVAETKRLSALVDRLLLPHRNIQFNCLNIHEVTERVLQLMHAELELNPDINIELQRDYDPSIPELFADKGQLIQALLNIGRNALEALSHSKQGSFIRFATRITRSFTIGNQRHKLVCILEVSDDGPGIPKALHDSLFMPMVSGRATGSGLGLSIAQSIINRHQGIIHFTSHPGATRFTIHLPITSEPPGDH